MVRCVCLTLASLASRPPRACYNSTTTPQRNSSAPTSHLFLFASGWFRGSASRRKLFRACRVRIREPAARLLHAGHGWIRPARSAVQHCAWLRRPWRRSTATVRLRMPTACSRIHALVGDGLCPGRRTCDSLPTSKLCRRRTVAHRINFTVNGSSSNKTPTQPFPALPHHLNHRNHLNHHNRVSPRPSSRSSPRPCPLPHQETRRAPPHSLLAQPHATAAMRSC